MDAFQIATTLLTASILVVTSVYAWHTRVLVRNEQRELALLAYGRAVDMLLAMKEQFAVQAEFFQAQMRAAGVEDSMAGLSAPEFLLLAQSMWRLSYVHSVANTEFAWLNDDEREGLNREVALWLSLPAIESIFRAHTLRFKAHNPRFVEAAEELLLAGVTAPTEAA